MLYHQNGITYSKGTALPFGPSRTDSNGVNFSINSAHAVSCTLVLYHKGDKAPYAELTLPDSFRTGSNYAITVYDLDIDSLEYGFRFDGPYDEAKGLLFNRSKVLMDPYSYGVAGHAHWGKLDYADTDYPLRSCIPSSSFPWEEDAPLNISLADTIIYEAHVRSFTQDPASGVTHPGTFQGLREKIPYLRQLGINCLELMPIFDFNEREFDNQPEKNILNLWGYSPLSFFAPKASYGSAEELKSLIKELHKNNIQLILDVVYNHTGEFAPNGQGRPLIHSLRGIDNPSYYLLKENGEDYNLSGCFNTFNSNHPLGRELILASLRHWVTEYHVDGFRFDLASILTRDQRGEVNEGNNLLRDIAQDPILAKTKLIAEPWDAQGLYQMGSLPAPDSWSQWNDRYRNSLRSYLLGDAQAGRDLVKRIQGSPDIFPHQGAASINFVTCHDGFTLRDLYSYNHKHNLANGDKNKDGSDWNLSHNCGIEGATQDPHILALRRQCMKNALTILLLSRGVPMLLAGDELGNSQQGNNNSYCQDNPIGWLNWEELEEHRDIFVLVQTLTHLRHEHPILRSKELQNRETPYPYPELSFHGTRINDIHLEEPMLTFAALYVETKEHYQVEQDSFIYLGMNQYTQTQQMELPPLPEGFIWRKYIDTSEQEHLQHSSINSSHYALVPRAVLVLVAQKEQ